MEFVKIISANWGKKDSHTLATYQENGGYVALKKAFGMKAEDIVAEVQKSNLRGRGGAGFPTGLKWNFVLQEKSTPKYLVVNADEGEPGTFKDRYILSEDPHMFVEGCIIASYTLGVNAVYVYCRGEFIFQMQRLKAAIDEAYAANLLGKDIQGTGFNLDIHVHPGAGAYICGEETALLESLEGKKGWPRLKPPFPANSGLFGKPTAVNNVETIAAIPFIVEHGGQRFADIGVDRNGGTRLFAVSGHVAKPGVYELPMGISLKSVIYDHAGGIANGRKLKAVIPGGSSAPVLTAAEVDVASDFDTLRNMKTMAGSGGVMVIDDTVNMALALRNVMKFYSHESCGQCTPCREGTGWMDRVLDKIVRGEGEERDVDLVYKIAKQGEMRTICALFDGAAGPAMSYISKFREDFLALVKPNSAPKGKPVLLPVVKQLM